VPGRPPKPVELLKYEKKSHRTKAELATREKAEQSLLTGIALKAWPEVKADKVAIKEFNRVKKLLKTISHNDALHEAVINRYCILTSECKQAEQTIVQLRGEVVELVRLYQDGKIEPIQYVEAKGGLHNQIIAWDKKLMDKRKMLLQIERENIMTILAALRAIPKKPQEEVKSPMAEFLAKKQAGR
jgi:phage terminase small subunit